MMDNEFLNIAKEIVLNIIDKDSTSVFLFGSRADSTFRKDSDMDIGFLGKDRMDLLIFHRIREALENSSVPYHFDLVDFSYKTSEFKDIALKNIIIWNKAKNLS